MFEGMKRLLVERRRLLSRSRRVNKALTQIRHTVTVLHTCPGAQVQHPTVLVLSLRVGYGGTDCCLRIIAADLTRGRL